MQAAVMVPGPEGGHWDIREVQRPTVPPGHVLLRVHASSINRAEFRRLHNLRTQPGKPAPEERVGGGDAAGEIAELGAGVVGFKPSRGLISTVGLVPACKSLDCISVMAGSIDDVDRVFDVVAARDDNDPWSRQRGPRYDGSLIRVGLPPVDELEFFGDETMRSAHLGFREHLARIATVVDVSLAPFLAAGSLLYQGPWVAERLVEFGDFLAAQPDSIHPVVREILRGGQKYTAVDAFTALQCLAELKALVAPLWQQMDALVVPTIGTTFTVDEVLAAPIDCNTMLGHYTHFGNLLDLSGVAVPLGVTTDGRPYSAMLLGAVLTDDTVLHLASQILDEPREVSSSPLSAVIKERV